MKRLLLTAIILALALGAWLARPYYRRHKEQRLVSQAQVFLEKKEYAKAWLSVRQIFQLNPNNIAACRMMAQVTESSHSPQTLVWRRKLAELEPTLSNRLTLASCGLRFENPPFPLATKTLESIAAEAKQNPAFHVASAERALKLNQFAAAEFHLQEAGRLEPANQLHQMNLLVLRLKSPQSNVVAEARAKLEDFVRDPQYGIVALRSLAVEALSRKDFAAAERFSKLAVANTNSVFSDRIQYLGVAMEQSGWKMANGSAASRPPTVQLPSSVSDLLASLQMAAGTNLAHIYELATWMNGRQMASEALTWLASLPPTIQIQQPLPLLMADCHMFKQDWPTLEKWLRAQQWSDQEFLRLAILARALRGQGEEDVAKVNWNKALRAASEKAELLEALLRVAQGWGWGVEVEELLWQVAKLFPEESWAPQWLEKSYLERGDTRGLLQVYSAMNRADPKNLLVKNNLATVSLLLKTNSIRAHQWAAEVYAKYPTNGAVASTYAFSLYTQGKPAEGLAALGKLTEPDLQQPSTAAYYALLLSVSGDVEKAGRYRAIAERAPLLPEEKALLGHVEERSSVPK